ncbi:MAG: response regulator [bacterium]
MTKQILVVDDDENVLELVEAESPDLVLFDVMLPEMDGWDVLRILRSKTRTQHIPVIYLTAKDDEIDEAIGLELRANDYITTFQLDKVESAHKKRPAQNYTTGE